MPVPGEKLPHPVLDFWTKLETIDRKLTEDEAKKTAGLSGEEFDEIKGITLKVNDFLNKRAEQTGLEHADGKVEFAFDHKRELMLVDVFGTPDENRFLLNGYHISKQVLRDYYKSIPWGKEFEKAKHLPEEKWPSPPRAPAELIAAVSNLYKAVCELWAGEKIWGIKLEEAIEALRKTGR